MEQIINNLVIGMHHALELKNLLYAFVGVFLGNIVGVLPGIGPTAVISILIPLTFTLNDPVGSIIMLSGIYYGTQYGGSITAILLKLPGEVSTMVTTIDGYKMAQKGRAGAALLVAALSSFFAGTIATFFVAFAAMPLALFGFKFGPAEYTNIIVLGLLISVFLTQGSFVNGLAMLLCGILIGLVGIDQNTGNERFTFGILDLSSGFSFAVVAIGVFGISEIIYNIVHQRSQHIRQYDVKHQDLSLTKEEVISASPAAVRGTVIGSILGLLPGPGALVGAVSSYVFEKKLAKNDPSFGNGNIKGVAGPEAANNAASQTSLIPVLALGLPFSPVAVLIVGAMIMNNVVPGPGLIDERPDLFWGVIAAMWVSNFILLILNLPLIKVWVHVLSIPKKILFTIIILVAGIGAYSINYNMFDVYMLIIFSFLGYFFKTYGLEPAPFIMGFILGEFLEEYARRSLNISNGNWEIFIASDISLILFSGVVLLIMLKILRLFRKFWLTRSI